MKYLIFTLLIVLSGYATAGYEIHIERNDGIPLEEWLDLCESDSTLEYKKTVGSINPQTDEVISMSLEGMCTWNQSATFYYSTNNISVRYTKEVLKKAKEIASKLNANVIGDEGEKY